MLVEASEKVYKTSSRLSLEFVLLFGDVMFKLGATVSVVNVTLD